jgi:hypothetical protein
MARVLKRETTLSRKARMLLRDSVALPRAALIEAGVGGAISLAAMVRQTLFLPNRTLWLLAGSLAALAVGHTVLSRRRGRVVLSRAALVEVALGGAISLAAMVRQALFLPNRTLWFLAGSLAALAIGHTLKARDRRTEAGRVAAGRKGERQVSARLAKLPDDAIVLNDVHVRSGSHTAQIDHLVISPRGIFVLESKRWRGRIEGDERAATWRQVRPDGRHVRLHNPVRQSLRHAELLREHLRSRGVGPFDVRALLVSSIPGTRFSIANRTLPIYEPDEAARYIETIVPGRLLTREEIDSVLVALDIRSEG